MQLPVHHGAELGPRTVKGETPLAVAVRKGKTEAAAWLRAKGAKD